MFCQGYTNILNKNDRQTTFYSPLPWKLINIRFLEMCQLLLFSGAEASFTTLSADHGGEPGNAQVECDSENFEICQLGIG